MEFHHYSIREIIRLKSRALFPICHHDFHIRRRYSTPVIDIPIHCSICSFTTSNPQVMMKKSRENPPNLSHNFLHNHTFLESSELSSVGIFSKLFTTTLQFCAVGIFLDQNLSSLSISSLICCVIRV
jgi:hypothetical protein